MFQKRTSQCRSGAALVEMAFVLPVFFLFLFGILEFSRLIFVKQVMTNAAREGCRYAVANVTSPTLDSEVQAVILKFMSNQDKQTKYYKSQVYLSNSSGTSIGSAGDAGFGEYIGCQIDYDYYPLLASFLGMKGTIRLTVRDMMFSEAN